MTTAWFHTKRQIRKEQALRRKQKAERCALQYGYAGGCIVPGCGRDVRLHHIVPRREGGTNAMANLMPICAHHEALVHKAGHYARKYLLNDGNRMDLLGGVRKRSLHAALPQRGRMLYGCMDCGFNLDKRPAFCAVCKVSGDRMGHMRRG